MKERSRSLRLSSPSTRQSYGDRLHARRSASRRDRPARHAARAGRRRGRGDDARAGRAGGERRGVGGRARRRRRGSSPCRRTTTRARSCAASSTSRGVESAGPRGERTGVVVSLVQPDGDRTMASDRGSAPELRAEDIEGEWLACDALHLSGYSLMREPDRRSRASAPRGSRASTVRTSASTSRRGRTSSGSAPSMRERSPQIEPDVVFGNEREWDAIGDVETPTRVVKRGPRGIVVDGEEHDARSRTAVDSTGAGDALAAGFIVGGTQLALETAARCVASSGRCREHRSRR